MDLEKGWDTLEEWARRGRLGRRRYVRVNVLSMATGFAVIFFPFLVISVLPDFNSNFLTFPIAAIGIAAAIVVAIIYMASSMARLRDMGRSPNWFVLGLVPYANLLFFLALAFVKGDKFKKHSVGKDKDEKKDEDKADTD